MTAPIRWHVETPSKYVKNEGFGIFPGPPRELRWWYVITYIDSTGINRMPSEGSYPSAEAAREAGEQKARALFDAPGPLPAPKPQTISAPPPSQKMPDEVRALYKDAGRVASRRAANALLRVACEDLCRLKGIPRGRDGFYGTIQNLREREGISKTLTDALDAIRITGNDATHGNETDYDILVEKLFKLVNIIVDEWGNADEVASVYDVLPDAKKVPRPS